MSISGTTIACIVAIVIIGYGIFLLYPIYHSTNVSKALIAAAIPYEQHPAHPTQYVLVAGDSTAVGVGTTNNIYSTAGRLGQQFPDADITNVAVSGARLKDLIGVLQKQQSIGKHYNLMLIQIGANDVTHLTPYATVNSEVATVFTLANQLSSKTIVLTAGNMGLSDVFHWPFSTLMTSRSLGIRKIFMTQATNFPTIHYIDLFKSKQDDPFGKDVPKYYAPDHFHLTNDGYGIWYSDIIKYN